MPRNAKLRGWPEDNVIKRTIRRKERRKRKLNPKAARDEIDKAREEDEALFLDSVPEWVYYINTPDEMTDLYLKYRLKRETWLKVRKDLLK